MGTRSHTDLHVWTLADEVRGRVLALVHGGRFGEQPWLGGQLLRASQSACANVAEGFARYQPRDFARFLRVTKGSLLEVEEHLLAARRLNAISEPELAELTTLIHRALGCATRLIRYLESAKPP